MNDNSDKPTVNITSHNQSGGVTAETVNINQTINTHPQFEMSPVLMKRISEDLDSNKKVVLVASAKTPRSAEMAAELREFLKHHGFENAGFAEIGTPSTIAYSVKGPVTIFPDGIGMLGNPQTVYIDATIPNVPA